MAKRLYRGFSHHCMDGATMRVTLKDVASLAGVSEGTASRALADSLRVNPATRKRIKAISKKVGYRPNIRARALATG